MAQETMKQPLGSRHRVVSRYLRKAAYRILDSLEIDKKIRASIFKTVDERVDALRAEDNRLSTMARFTLMTRSKRCSLSLER